MKKNKKKRQIAVRLAWFLLVGEGMAFLGCDQIQDFLKPATPPDPDPPLFLAEGGARSLIEVDGTTYEVHTFTAAPETPSGGQATDNLTFVEDVPAETLPQTVEVLVVGGGGGGGGGDASDRSGGGGGAGGYVYVQSYPINAGGGPIPVTVGAGGGGGNGGDPYYGTNGGGGGNSQFGGGESLIVAYGGGGGGRNFASTSNPGSPGGSGGGGNYTSGGGSATKGAVTPNSITPAPDILGNAGGWGTNAAKAAAGGGGAGDVGGCPPGIYGGALGGRGVKSPISGTERWYAGGGAGGAVKTVPADGEYPAEAYGATGANDGEAGTGDGGSGGGGLNIRGDLISGGNGGSGIVIVRFPRTGGTE
jgi:hypothetical protein